MELQYQFKKVLCPMIGSEVQLRLQLSERPLRAP